MGLVLKVAMSLLWAKWTMFLVDVDWGSFFKKRLTVEVLRQQFLPVKLAEMN